MSLLLAVDLNDPTDGLLAEALAWAKRLGTKLDLVYVDDYPYGIQDLLVQDMLRVEWGKLRENNETRIRTLLATLPPEVRGHGSVRHGRVPEEIVEAGKAHHAILVATHGRRGVAHVFLGSVAERVVRLSTVPVLVLPARASEDG